MTKQSSMIVDGIYTQSQILDAIDGLKYAGERMPNEFVAKFKGGRVVAYVIHDDALDEPAPVPESLPVANPKAITDCHKVGCRKLATHGPQTIPISCLEHRDMAWGEIWAKEEA